MNICGVLVHARPERIALVKAQLLELPGVEVHGFNDDGRMVVTIEEDDNRQMGETLTRVQNLQGALSASMIYHHCEDEREAIAEEAE